MIHVPALPGTPGHHLSMAKILDKVLFEAHLLEKSGFDAIMIENMHDIPYLNKKVGPEIVAAMASIASTLRKNCTLDLGIQVLAGANKEALSIALAADFQFIRAEGFVFGHLADEGYMDACAGGLLRFRKNISAEHIAIFTDIKKKHASHQISSDVPLSDTIKAAEFFLSDGIIVTGNETGSPVLPSDVEIAHKTTQLPVIIGSGVTTNNIENVWNLADAFIVGSWLKDHHYWKNNINEQNAIAFMEKIKQLRLITT